MTRREELQDQYEDALFALLMDDIATLQEKEAEEENERLNNDPAFTIPEDVDRRCLQTIRRYSEKQRAYAAGRFTVKVLKRAAMVAGIAALMFTGVFAASEALRVNTMNLIVEVFDTNTDFRFASVPVDPVSEIGVGWLPEGYTIAQQGNDGLQAWYLYQKSENMHISILYTPTSGSGIGVDTEDAEVEYVEVQGSQAMLIKKENNIQIVWAAKDNTVFIALSGEGVGQEDLIHVANELKY